MTGGFTKLFSSIVTSSIWQESDQTRLVWITLMAMANKDGDVNSSLTGLAFISRVPLEAAQKAVETFLAPDPQSRTPENDGRRLESIDGGWHLLNHAKYRGILNKEERTEYLRIKKQESRARMSANVLKSQHCQHKQKQKQSTEAEAKKEKEKPSISELEDFCSSLQLPRSDGTAMFFHWEGSKWPKDWRITIRKWKEFDYLPSQKRTKPWGMSVFEIDKRIEAVNQEIDRIFKGNRNKRVEGDGIDELKARRAELKKRRL